MDCLLSKKKKIIAHISAQFTLCTARWHSGWNRLRILHFPPGKWIGARPGHSPDNKREALFNLQQNQFQHTYTGSFYVENLSLVEFPPPYGEVVGKVCIKANANIPSLFATLYSFLVSRPRQKEDIKQILHLPRIANAS